MKKGSITIFERVKYYLKTPTFRDEEQNRIARLLQISIITLIIGIVIGLFNCLLFFFLQTGLILILGLVGVVGSYILLRYHHLRIASWILLLSFMITLIFMLLVGDGSHDIVIMLFPVAIMVAGLLLGKRSLIVFSLIVILSLQSIILAEVTGVIVNGMSDLTLIADMVAVMAILIISAVEAFLLSGSIRSSFRRALLNERALNKSNITLKSEINERNQVEESLRKSEKLYRTLIKTTSEGYWRVGPDLITIDVNNSLCNMLGYSKKEIMGTHIFDFFEEDDLKIMKKHASQISRTKYRSYEIPLRKKNGETFHAHFNATTLPEMDGVKQGSFALITDMTGPNELMEEIQMTNRALKNSEKVTLKILEDLSRENEERKIAEEGKELEMNRAELYLDLLGHDIGNLHQGIDGWLTIAKGSCDNKIMLNKALDGSKRLTEETLRLVKNVLMLSRLKDVERLDEKIDMVKVVNDAIENAKVVFIGTELEINLKCDEKNIYIRTENIISEVVFNLIHNSIKFQGLQKAVLDIRISKDEKGKIMILHIADHGPGIPDEQKINLFNRGKIPQKKIHTGIGLLLVSALVERYRGTIKVENRVKDDQSRGSRFIIELPLF